MDKVAYICGVIRACKERDIYKDAQVEEDEQPKKKLPSWLVPTLLTLGGVGAVGLAGYTGHELGIERGWDQAGESYRRELDQMRDAAKLVDHMKANTPWFYQRMKQHMANPKSVVIQ